MKKILIAFLILTSLHSQAQTDSIPKNCIFDKEGGC